MVLNKMQLGELVTVEQFGQDSKRCINVEAHSHNFWQSPPEIILILVLDKQAASTACMYSNKLPKPEASCSKLEISQAQWCLQMQCDHIIAGSQRPEPGRVYQASI